MVFDGVSGRFSSEEMWAIFWISLRAWAWLMDEMSIRSLFSDLTESFVIVSKIDIESLKNRTGSFSLS